jgi:hypothetical protein
MPSRCIAGSSVNFRLCDYLAIQERARAPAAQWLGTINNLAQKGLRSEELQRSGLIDFLEATGADASPLTGKDLAQALDFSALRFSVIPNITEGRTQLHYEAVPDGHLAKIKDVTKPQAGQQRKLYLFDRVMGYRIDDMPSSLQLRAPAHRDCYRFFGSAYSRSTAVQHAVLAVV